MDGLRQYVFSVVAAAILCAVLGTMVTGKGTAASLTKLISGIFLAFVVIRPVADIDLGDIPSLLEQYSLDGSAAVSEGENIAHQAAAAIIKEQTEAYILDKAETLGLELTVEVILTDDQLPVPAAVRISGSVSPYAKASMQTMLEEDLGISKENQLWIG